MVRTDLPRAPRPRSHREAQRVNRRVSSRGSSQVAGQRIHPGTTRTERTLGLLAPPAAELGITPEEVERRDFAPGSPRGNAIGRMVDASEIAYLTAFLASDKAWAITGELIVANGGAGQAVYY